jgi:hypothetical protein
MGLRFRRVGLRIGGIGRCSKLFFVLPLDGMRSGAYNVIQTTAGRDHDHQEFFRY